jgi:hypothetical protein
MALRAKLESNKEFQKAWFNNISEYYYKDMWEKLDPDVPVRRNMVNRYYGEPGCGKSWASLFDVYLQTEYFGFTYENLFSQMDASVWLAKAAYDANKKGHLVTRCVMNIDEDRKMFGAGSAQEETFFDGFTEFLRQAQINLHVLNPNDIKNIDTQFECIGWDNQGYEKSIIYQKIDRRIGTYKPLGYVVTKMPPQNYIASYGLQKDDFLKNFVGNRSGRNAKNDAILSIVWGDLPERQKELIRSTIILNRERDTKFLIYKELQFFNLPVGYTNQLVDAFKWKYFAPELQRVINRKEAEMHAKMVKAGITERPPEVDEGKISVAKLISGKAGKDI